MEPTAYRPHYCVWELTLSCNLRCDHCGSAAGRPRPSELSTAECLDVVAQLAELDCRLITLSGGEPTLRGDWEEIARAAIARGITTNMVSNGTTITAEVAKRAAAAGLANVGVSLDGPAELHDRVRGPGTFERATRGLNELRRAGVSTAVLTHLDQATAACLEQMHQLAVDLGAAAWRVQLGKPMGRLCENRQRLLAPEDLLTVLPRLARIKRGSPIRVEVGDSIGYFGPYERTLRRAAWGNMRDTWSGCQAGRFAIGIESDGGVKGCLSLQAKLEGCGERDPFREGDLRTKRLADLWFAPGAFAFNREQQLEDLTGGCRSCGNARVCRGGAKCVAAAFTGALTEDPYCYARVERLTSTRARIAHEVRRGAATAALSLGLGACLGGCYTPVDAAEDEAKVLLEGPEARAQRPANPGSAATPDASVDPCAATCPQCEYGVLPPGCQPVAAAGEPDAGCSEPCVGLDYGVWPDPPGCCAQEPADAGTPPDGGDECQNVCCECDYGLPPPPQCCK